MGGLVVQKVDAARSPLLAPGAPGPRLVRVALPVPLGQSFTYAVPEALAYVLPGARVAVEFGRRRCLGVALELTEELPAGVSADRIKPLLGVIDRQPALPAELLSF